jgi:hypothetical protein
MGNMKCIQKQHGKQNIPRDNSEQKIELRASRMREHSNLFGTNG